MYVHPYLLFPGNARDALTRYAQVLGGQVTTLLTYGESPEGEAPEPYRSWIMHGCLEFGGQLLMASDHAPFCPGPAYEGIKGCSISIQIPDLKQAGEVFAQLGEGGRVQMPFGPTFWARGFGMCVDRYGVPWMVNCASPLHA